MAVAPDFAAGEPVVGLVDLFAGCGGMSLGAARAVHESGFGLAGLLAVDFDPIAAAVYQANFPDTDVRNEPVEKLFDGQLGQPPTDIEDALLAEIDPPVHLLIGGPPCQGHSDLNNISRRNDPRNELYLRMARAAEVLTPTAVMIENVPAVRHSQQNVVQRLVQWLGDFGYLVAEAIVDVSELGVSQRRKRHVLLGLEEGLGLHPQDVLTAAQQGNCQRTLRWAIGDLAGLEPIEPFDTRSRASQQNQERMDWLIANDAYDLPNARRPTCHQDGNHSYNSVYGRMHWEKPAQTITTGFTSMGQGRYVHPAYARTLTPHEAARIQGFPDFFNFEIDGPAQRTAWSKLIGNAVPPELSRAVLAPVVAAIAPGLVAAEPAAMQQPLNQVAGV